MAGEACASRKRIVCLGCVAGGRVAQQLDDMRNRNRGNALADKTPAAIAEGAEPILLGVATLPPTVVFGNVCNRASMSNCPVAALEQEFKIYSYYFMLTLLHLQRIIKNSS